MSFVVKTFFFSSPSRALSKSEDNHDDAPARAIAATLQTANLTGLLPGGAGPDERAASLIAEVAVAPEEEEEEEEVEEEELLAPLALPLLLLLPLPPSESEPEAAAPEPPSESDSSSARYRFWKNVPEDRARCVATSKLRASALSASRAAREAASSSASSSAMRLMSSCVSVLVGCWRKR